MKQFIVLFCLILIASSCSTNRTLNQAKFKNGTKLIKGFERDKGYASDVIENYFIVYESQRSAVGSIDLKEDKIRVSINDQSKIDSITTITATKNIGLELEPKFRLGNRFTYYSELNKHGLNLIHLDTIQSKKLNIDTIQESLNGSYSFCDKIVYFEDNVVYQTLTIPFKFRRAIADKPKRLSTNFNAGFALGYQRDKTTIKPIYKNIDQTMVGYDKTNFAYSLSPFIGLTSISLNSENTNQSILIEQNVLGVNFGGVMVFEVNSFNIGFAIGWDYGLDNSSSWDYQGECWTGLVLGIDLIK